MTKLEGLEAVSLGILSNEVKKLCEISKSIKLTGIFVALNELLNTLLDILNILNSEPLS